MEWSGCRLAVARQGKLSEGVSIEIDKVTGDSCDKLAKTAAVA